MYTHRRETGMGVRRKRGIDGTYVDDQGYVHEYDPQRQHMVRQHRLVMERLLGRALYRWETPHHKNGNRADNDPENLELWVQGQPSGVRVADVYAKDIERLALENWHLKAEVARLRALPGNEYQLEA